MNTDTAFYPWVIDWRTLVEIFLGGLAFLVAVYIAARSGRMERGSTERPGKRPLHWFAGLVATDSNPVTVFLWLLIVVLAVWAVLYVAWLAANGVKY